MQLQNKIIYIYNLDIYILPVGVRMCVCVSVLLRACPSRGASWRLAQEAQEGPQPASQRVTFDLQEELVQTQPPQTQHLARRDLQASRPRARLAPPVPAGGRGVQVRG